MSDAEIQGHSSSGDGQNFLGRELPYRALYIAVAATLAVCVLFAVLLFPMVKGFASWTDNTSAREQRGPAPANSRPVGPLLQAKPEDQLIDYDREIARELESYGWVDQSAGIARIPVERAREMILAEGLMAGPDTAADGEQAQQ
jgi:hypothetical protein